MNLSRRTAEPTVADHLSKRARSEVMSRVRNKDTGPELAVRRLLHRAGYRFRLHASDLPGSPDLVLPRFETVVFVHGCFWHGHDCSRGARPTSNTDFWNEKIAVNQKRDREVRHALEEEGWSIVTVWECELREPTALLARLTDFLDGRG